MAGKEVSTEGDMVTFDAQAQTHEGKHVIKYIHYYDADATAGTDGFVLNDTGGKLISKGIADQQYMDKIYPAPDGKKTGLVLTTLTGGGTVTVAFKLDGARE